MPDITFTISAAHTTRLVGALTGLYHYQENVYDPKNPGERIPNPESKNAFAKRTMAEWAKNQTLSWENKLAKDAAGAADEITVDVA